MKPYGASINYHYDALYEYLMNLPTLHFISGYTLATNQVGQLTVLGVSCVVLA